MITFRDIQLAEIIDEVILRMKGFVNPENMDWDTLVLLVNRSLQEVLTRTLPYKQWAYVDKMTVTHGTVLPRDYIDKIRLLASEDGTAPYREARCVDVREWFAFVDWQKQNTWSRETALNPVYMLWGSAQGIPPRFTIFIAPNTDWQTGTAPYWTEYYTGNNYGGIFEFYRMPNILRNDTDIVPIPAEYQELLVLGTVGRWMAKIGDANILPNLAKEVMTERMRIQTVFAEKAKVLDASLMDAFVKEVPYFSGTPPQDEERKAFK